ncbi:MAG: tetratricopeptide repeat protein [Chitinophagaceae bacterium]|nr:tetratricopeptide repeat protein [Chitinophagaceae bacterium]
MKNKFRFSLLVMALVGFCGGALAQTVDQGKKFLYYQRYKSAKDVFDKILASNPNNIEAIYWQGQTLLEMRDSVAAGDLYSKALQSNGNAPLLLAGMGEVELRLGKTTDARQRFETAISLTKAKDIDVLNAVADANIDSKAGDATYAIEKLNTAMQVKKFNSVDTYILLGDAYRKLIDGGNAVQSYQKALTIDPKYAEAKYKIGKIYLTQNNKEFFLPAFEEAVQMDPAYAPAYYELFYFYYFHWDPAKATEYLQKYTANSDPGPEVEYLNVDFLIASGKFAEAKTKAQGLITSLGDKVTPRMYKTIAYACDTTNDVACAQQNIATYFQKADASTLTGADYALEGSIQSKATDSAGKVKAIESYKKAISRDTLPENRAKYLAKGLELAKKLNYKQGVADLAAIEYATKKDPNQNDVYNWGISNYQAGNYKTADSIFCGIYESKWPNEIFGYLWCARSKQAQDDSANSQGLAVEAYDKLASVGRAMDSTAKAAGSTDSVKYKNTIITSYFYLAQYYNDVKKDKNMAIAYLQKVLEVDPTNATAQKFKDILSKPPARQQSAGGAKPRTGAR